MRKPTLAQTLTPVGDTDQPKLAAWRAIRARMEAAAHSVGRDPNLIRLTAVSKQQPWEAVSPILEGGQRTFGENRVQEAQGRWAEVKAADPTLELHLIGPLQTNKAKDAAAFFDVIETLDRERLAEALARAASASGSLPRLYVEVNTGEEPQKAGVLPAEVDGFLAKVRDEYQLPVEGLMCIPPQNEAAGPHFALLADLASRNGLSELSMGMSGDFETAIRYGTTSVRVGSALFGARPLKAGLKS